MKTCILVGFSLFILISTVHCCDLDTCNHERRFSIVPYLALKWIAGSNYIPIHNFSAQTPFQEIQYMGFTKQETVGGGLSFLYTLVRGRSWDFQIGLNYGLRHNRYYKDGEINSYINLPSLYSVRNYNYQFHNLEFVVLPAYKFSLLHIALGVVYSPLTYKISNYDYEWVDAYLGISHSFHKTIRAWAKNNLVLPTAQVSLPIKKFKIPLAVLASVQYSVGDRNEIYYNLGLKVSINKR